MDRAIEKGEAQGVLDSFPGILRQYLGYVVNSDVFIHDLTKAINGKEIKHVGYDAVITRLDRRFKLLAELSGDTEDFNLAREAGGEYLKHRANFIGFVGIYLNPKMKVKESLNGIKQLRSILRTDK